MDNLRQIETILNRYTKERREDVENVIVNILELLGYEVDYSMTYNEYRIKQGWFLRTPQNAHWQLNNEGI